MFIWQHKPILIVHLSLLEDLDLLGPCPLHSEWVLLLELDKDRDRSSVLQTAGFMVVVLEEACPLLQVVDSGELDLSTVGDVREMQSVIIMRHQQHSLPANKRRVTCQFYSILSLSPCCDSSKTKKNSLDGKRSSEKPSPSRILIASSFSMI
jgi:hypothetical protein